MGRDGSGQRKLTTPGSASDGDPAWSADDAALYFTRWVAKTESSSIFSIRTNGTGLHRLATATPGDWGGCIGSPSASPDGRLVAFTDYGDCAHGISSVSAMTTAGRPVGLPFAFPETTIDYSPAWAPDGRRLVYAVQVLDQGRSGVYVSSSDGSPPGLVATAEYVQTPAWSPDGKWIAFTDKVATKYGYSDDIWLVRSDGTQRRAVTRTNADDGDPAWLPPLR